jgi:hypothetical protein
MRELIAEMQNYVPEIYQKLAKNIKHYGTPYGKK